MLTEEVVLNALRKVQDPELHRDLVSGGGHLSAGGGKSGREDQRRGAQRVVSCG